MVWVSKNKGNAPMSQTVSSKRPKATNTVHTEAEDGDMTTTKQKHDKSKIDHDKHSDAFPNHENASIGETVDLTTKSDPSLSTRIRDPKSKNNNVLAVIFLQIIVLVLMLLLTMQYSWLHNVPTPLSALFGNQNIESFAEAIANYDFVGVTPPEVKPSIFAVVLEVAIWSLAGVLARSEYYLSQIIVRKKQFDFWESSSKLISDGSMGIAIAIAVVLFVRATEFMELSFQNASVASIAAISFILGFYHEDTRRLLSSFQRRISESTDESKDNKDKD